MNLREDRFYHIENVSPSHNACCGGGPLGRMKLSGPLLLSQLECGTM